MDSFRSYMLREAYQNVKKKGAKLAEVDPLIDWNRLRSIIQPIYDNQGIPHAFRANRRSSHRPRWRTIHNRD